MKFRLRFVTLLVITAGLLWTPDLLAQKWEIHPYAGGFWPDSSEVGELKSDGIYGARAGFFFDPNVQIEGNFGWINHFEPTSVDPEARGILWEVSGLFNFSAAEFIFPERFMPYFAVGVGGITTILDDPEVFPFSVFGEIQPVGGAPVPTVRTIQIEDGDTFFAVSYGGGIKSSRLWGPVGLRGDVRGRTLPNYYGGSPTWLEASGGINFMWGER